MNAFDEENFKVAVKLLTRHRLSLDKSDIVADMLEYYSEQRVNNWLSKISDSRVPDRAFESLIGIDEESLISARRMRPTPKNRDHDYRTHQSCGEKDESGLQGRYSLAIDFTALYNDPEVFYGTWEETPSSRRRFR